MKKWIWLAAILFAISSVAGCASVQKKFTRKKKEVKTMPRVIQEKKYDIKPSPELYSKHFAYWQSWSSELLQDLGQNHKKDVRCIEELMGQLDDMKDILVQEKADGLQKHINRYKEIRDTIVNQDMSTMVMNTTRMDLDREDRIIKNDFSVKRIRNYIKKSFDAQQSAQPALVSAQDQPAVAAQENKDVK
jgi:hypothetical protein